MLFGPEMHKTRQIPMLFEGKAKNNVVFYPLSGTKTVVFTWVLAI